MSDDTPVKRTGSKRRTKAQRQEERETVVQMFGRAPLKEDPPMDPNADRPGPAKGLRKGRVAAVSARMAEIQDRIDAGTITMTEFVKCLTPEELIRGQLKAHDGTFKGRPPKWVPQEFYQACVRELLARGENKWREAFLDAVDVFTEIAKDPRLDAKDRMKAAQYVIERVAGKTPERIEVATVAPWEQMISGIVAEAEDEAIANAARILNTSEG